MFLSALGFMTLNKCMLKYPQVLILFNMPYSETKVIIGGLAHIPVIIFLVNFIKEKFEARTQSNTSS